MGDPQILVSMISGFCNVSPALKTNYFYLWRHPDIAQKSRNTWNIYQHIIFINLKTLQYLKYLWKRRAPKNDEDLSKEFLDILDMISISIKKHDMGIW